MKESRLRGAKELVCPWTSVVTLGGKTLPGEVLRTPDYFGTFQYSLSHTHSQAHSHSLKHSHNPIYLPDSHPHSLDTLGIFINDCPSCTLTLSVSTFTNTLCTGTFILPHTDTHSHLYIHISALTQTHTCHTPLPQIPTHIPLRSFFFFFYFFKAAYASSQG